jgi:hypothetical protein
MGLRDQELSIDVLTRGLYSAQDLNSVPLGGASATLNMAPSRDGALLQKRMGINLFNGTTLPNYVTASTPTIYPVGDSQSGIAPAVMATFSGPATTQLWYIAETGVATQITTGIVPNTRWISTRNSAGSIRYYGVCNASGFQSVVWDGVAGATSNWVPTSGSLLPNAQHIWKWKGKVYLAADTRIQWSAPDDPDTWPSTNFVDIDKRNGPITGIVAAEDYLYVFKYNQIYVIYDHTTGANRVIREHNGVWRGGLLEIGNFFACCGGPNQIFWLEAPHLGPRVYAMDPGGSTREISGPIRERLAQLTSNALIYTRLVYANDRLYLMTSGGATAALSRTMFMYDISTDSWWEWLINTGSPTFQLFDMCAMNTTSLTGDIPKVIAIAGSAPTNTTPVKTVCIDHPSNSQWDQFTSLNTYQSTWQSGDIDWGNPAYMRMRAMDIYGTGTTNLSCVTEGVAGTSRSAPLSTQQRYYFTNTKGRRFGVLLDDQAAAALNITIKRIGLFARRRST